MAPAPGTLVDVHATVLDRLGRWLCFAPRVRARSTTDVTRGRALLRLSTLIGLLLPGLAAAEPSHRSVLVLDQSSAGLPFNSALAAAVRLTLNAAGTPPISFYSEHLDANRFFGSEYEDNFVQFLKVKYRERPINVVVAVGVSALDFIARRREQIWPSVPVVFAAIDETTIRRLTLPGNVTGVTMQLSLLDMVRVARIVVPDLKAVAMVGDPLERQTFYRHFKEELPAVTSELQLIDLMNLPMAELERRLVALPNNAAVIYTGIYYDSQGVSYVPAELVTQIAAWSNRPVVVNVSSYLNKGAIGGYIVQADPIGQQAANLALRILAGESASDIPPVKIPSQLIFEWPALQRWGINEASLPSAGEIRFRVPGLWEQYRWQIVLVCAALITQACLISWLIGEHRRRSAAEVQSRNAMTELTHMNRVATAGELTASIAHEVNQPLTGIITRASAALRWLAAETPDLDKVRTALDQIVAAGERAAAIVSSVRAMFKKEITKQDEIDFHELIPSVLDIVRVELEKHAVERRLELHGNLPIIKGDQVQLQQVILNLVMNAIDAMQSVHYRLLVVRAEEIERLAVRVTIEDTGVGIDPKNVDRIFQALFTTKPLGMGIGLSICRSIIESHGGRLWVSGANAYGSIFCFELPVIRGVKPRAANIVSSHGHPELAARASIQGS
jgi:signal transduction histidine kinase